MKNYILIHNYMSGASLREQINEVIEAGKLDEDTRFFFPKNELISMEKLASLLGFFEIVQDTEFDMGNAVLKPSEWFIKSIKADEDKALTL